MLIRAVVDARLFGLRLLTLDARVVVAEADPIDPVVDIDPTVMPLARTSAGVRTGVHSTGRETDRGVRHARELLAQGTDTLAGLRRSGPFLTAR